VVYISIYLNNAQVVSTYFSGIKKVIIRNYLITTIINEVESYILKVIFVERALSVILTFVSTLEIAFEVIFSLLFKTIHNRLH